ncbi:MAG: TolB family protein, partial [Gemmatimonadales bacterium]
PSGQWNHQIYVLEVATGRIFQLTSGRGSSENPHWSPDGRHIAFSDGQNVHVIAGDGSDGRIVATARDIGQTAVRSVEWSADGTRLFAMAVNEGQSSIWSIPLGGGSPALTVEFDDPDRALVWPFFSHDGEDFYLNIAQFESDIWVMEIDW